MQRIVFLFLSLSLLVFTGPGWAASEAETTAHLEAAKRYARLAPVAALVNDAVNTLARQVPADQREEFAASMLESIDVKRLERRLLDGLLNNFTVKELNALADFYGSPEGRKILRKMGTFMAELQPEIQKEIMAAIQKSTKAGKTE